MMRILCVLACLAMFSGCNAPDISPDISKPGQVSKTKPDEHGVVCYTTAHKGEFSCVYIGVEYDE